MLTNVFQMRRLLQGQRFKFINFIDGCKYIATCSLKKYGFTLQSVQVKLNTCRWSLTLVQYNISNKKSILSCINK